MNKPSKIFLKYCTIIKRGLMTEREIISFRSAVGSYTRTTLTEDEKSQLVSMVDDVIDSRGYIDLETSQKQKGIDWINRKLFKTNGQLRNDQCVKNTYRVEHVAEIVKNFRDFTLVGFDDLGTNGYRQLMPVYRCHSIDGKYFDYVGRSGINIDVLNVKYY